MEPIIISASFFQEQPSLGVLGRTGEHEARRISFDCGEVLKAWPEAAILCVCRRPCDTAAYPIPLTADGTTYTMPLTSRETAAAGTIKLELRAVRNDTVLKSAIFYGRILLSLNGQKDAPGSPLSDALNRLESTIANAQTLADEIRQKLDNGEFVGERGPQGDKGDKGDPGANGAPGKDGKDGRDANVTAENIQSALGYAPVKDVQVTGSSVLDGGVANVPMAAIGVFGAVKIGTVQDTGIWVNNGVPYISYATDAEIAGRTGWRKVIVCANLDNAVKAAMCDGKGTAWTSAEQKTARERMGVDKAYELIEEITLTEKVTQLIRNAEPNGTPYHFKKMYVNIITPQAEENGSIYSMFNNALIGLAFNSIKSQSSEGGIAQIYAHVANGFLDGYGVGAPNVSTSSNLIRYVTRSNTPSGIAAIDSVKILGTVGIPINTNIKIYGVRA
nr:MAG TPA: nucleoid-associated protein [Caudoviricetes sp.]